jgi:hypothetical protein
VAKPGDEKRTLCAACEEAYTWGVQHGRMTAGNGLLSCIRNADRALLERQAAALGGMIDGGSLSPEQLTCFEGLWEFIHNILDAMEG